MTQDSTECFSTVVTLQLIVDCWMALATIESVTSHLIAPLGICDRHTDLGLLHYTLRDAWARVRDADLPHSEGAIALVRVDGTRRRELEAVMQRLYGDSQPSEVRVSPLLAAL